MADEEGVPVQDNTELENINIKTEDLSESPDEIKGTSEPVSPPAEDTLEENGRDRVVKNEVAAFTTDGEMSSENKEPENVETDKAAPTAINARTSDQSISFELAEVQIHTGQRTDSVVSSLPMTDTGIIEEMTKTRERCKLIENEIYHLKRELAESQQKKDLTEDDKLIMDTKTEQVVSNMAELEYLTGKVERMLGLSDPTSEELAKAFEMFPEPPHHRNQKKHIEDFTNKASLTCKDRIRDEESQHKFNTFVGSRTSSDDQFDVPPTAFPEDSLPRVIVCGYTEDNIPKIVVADSQRKPRIDEMQNLKSITGKLTEALNRQEKLAQENAHLEGNKYKLQEALLEKDTDVDLLQRKVCGLQKEMQFKIKENEGLKRQLVFLNECIANPTCCTSQDNSSRISNKPRADKESYGCSTARWATSERQSVCDSPRLGGGGSSEKNLSVPKINMGCRNPALNSGAILGNSPTRSPCPAEIEDKLKNYETSTKQLEQQLGFMESDVGSMKMELANLQRERQQLEQQRKLLKCTGPCAPCPCPSQDSTQMHQSTTGLPGGYDGQILSKISPVMSSACSGICIDQPPGTSNCPQQQLRDLREQYARLQEDYKNKLCEVSCLRTDSEKIKRECREARDAQEKMENRLIDLQERFKKIESERNKFGGSREQMIEDKHRLMVTEQRHKESLEELEELRLSNQEYLLQLEDYRNKYLKAQETVEEQTRQLDMMEMDNARMNENVTLEIGRVKNQFQEKLAELAPLPEILKQSQLKLQESQQMRAVAERNCDELDRELLMAKDKIGALSSQLDNLRSENSILKGEKGSGSDRLDDLENKISELRNENERLKNAVSRFEEREAENEEKLEQKLHEIIQLSSENDLVRQDAARQVARTKERCETIRRTMQDQIGDMEKQLAQCRATAKAAQKDRDEIRQKMQGQINRLSESFEQAQGRIRTLQGHVNYLKTSYSNVFSDPTHGDGPTSPLTQDNMSPNLYDACDCNS
ncbi:outer dense fiber protein 2 isoform X2 [Diachasmimorpha longicaudata]|uniref:outer dense fiber protein 2 isoform X2 n=1 Tax=Diachasmimorpha longicaudata TaxID=58733 RepID=UPI0030B8A0C5